MDLEVSKAYRRTRLRGEQVSNRPGLRFGEVCSLEQDPFPEGSRRSRP